MEAFFYSCVGGKMFMVHVLLFSGVSCLLPSMSMLALCRCLLVTPGVFIVSDVVIGRSPTGVVNGRRRNVSVTRSESRVCPSVRT